MEAVTTIDDVRTFTTSGGNTRFVIRDRDGREYTTFREAIGEQAQRLVGRRARLEFHEVQRGKYLNVYLDKVEPVGKQAGRVSLANEIWTARTDGETFDTGAEVRVVRIDGATAVVTAKES